MKKKVITVGPDDKIMDVSGIIFRYGFHGLPVVESGRVIGIITEDDFFIKGYDNLYLPSYIQFLKGNRIVDDLPRKVKEKMEKIFASKARDLMSSPCQTVFPQTSVEELLRLIKKTKFTTWPVADKKKNIIGIVTLVDILGSMTRGASEMEAAYDKSDRKKERQIDVDAKELGSFWSRTFVFIRKARVKTWRGIFLVAFISGLIAALIWTISIKIQMP